MKFKCFISIYLIFLYCSKVQSARILMVSLCQMRSHYILSNKLLNGLVQRGHEVTFLSPISQQKEPIKNYREILVDDTTERSNELKTSFHEHNELSSIQQLYQIIPAITQFAEIFLNSTNVQTLLKSNEKFDLVIQDSINDHALTGFAHHYDTPLIIFSTMLSDGWIKPFTNFVYPRSYIPQHTSRYSGKMTFFQRAHNGILSLVSHMLLNQEFEKHNRLLHKSWPDAPELSKLIRDRTQLVLWNYHPSFSIPKPSVPHVIEIGGFHIEKPKELPENLKSFLDTATEGVILFSLGSNVNFVHLPPKTKKIFLEVLAKLPYKILWKLDAKLPEKPNNVLIDKWLPQNDILAHPNVKLFITHGGLLSISEAIYHAVPIIGFPVFLDQPTNMAFVEQVGIGKAIYFNKLTSDVLFNTILEVLDNPIYRENIQQRSIMLRDQPMPPLDKAMYWIEFVLRHKSTQYLHTGTENLELYEVLLLDVISVAVIVLVSVVLAVYVICKKIMGALRRKLGLQEDKKNK